MNSMEPTTIESIARALERRRIVDKEYLHSIQAIEVNNSMFRLGFYTFQPTTIHKEGATFLDRIFNSKKGWKVCYNGKYAGQIHMIGDWETLKENYENTTT